MLPTNELFQKIRRIEIHTRHLVNDNFAGEYHSVFKGQGMEFDEVRQYQPGDEIRAIDWNVTARMGDAFIKRYVEERELTILLAVDTSASKDFGTANRFKRDLAAELAAVLAFAATNNNDKVGLLLFSDQIERYIPPRKGRKHVLRIIRELLTFEPESQGTDIGLALDTVNRMLNRRAIVFLVSDFITNPAGFRNQLAMANRRHDVIAVELRDPLEARFPDVGLITLEDAESGEAFLVDSSDSGWQQAFQITSRHIENERRRTFMDARVDRIPVTTAEDYTKALTSFFHKRARRLKK